MGPVTARRSHLPTPKRAYHHLECDDKAPSSAVACSCRCHSHLLESNHSYHNGDDRVSIPTRKRIRQADTAQSGDDASFDDICNHILTPLNGTSSRPSTNFSGASEQSSDFAFRHDLLPINSSQPHQSDMQDDQYNELPPIRGSNAQSQAGFSRPVSAGSPLSEHTTDNLFAGLHRIDPGSNPFGFSRDAIPDEWPSTVHHDDDFPNLLFPDNSESSSSISLTPSNVSQVPLFDQSLFPEWTSSADFDLYSQQSQQPLITVDTIDESTWAPTTRPYWLPSGNFAPYDIPEGLFGFNFSLSPNSATHDSATVELSSSDQVTVGSRLFEDNDYWPELLPQADFVSQKTYDPNFQHVSTNFLHANSTEYGSQTVEPDGSLVSSFTHSPPRQSSARSSAIEEISHHGSMIDETEGGRRHTHGRSNRNSTLSSRSAPISAFSDEKDLAKAVSGHSELYASSESTTPSVKYDPAIHNNLSDTLTSPKSSSRQGALSSIPHRQRISRKSTVDDNNVSLSQPTLTSLWKTGGGPPILTVREDSNDTQLELQELLARNNDRIKENTRASPSSPNNTDDEPLKVQWEHTFTFPGSFQRIDKQPPREVNQQKLGRRRGPLSALSKERASKIRRLRACWYCWIMKLPCSEGETCERCRGANPSPLTGSLCSRVNFRDYTDLFLPAPAVGMFVKSVVDKLVAEKVAHATDNKIQVYVTVGPTYPPIPILVHEYNPSDVEFLALPQLATDISTQKSTFTSCYTPPLALHDTSDTLKERCLEHIRSAIKSERNHGEVKYGETSRLAWDVFTAVSKYQRESRGNSLLRKTMMLYAMFYFMTRSITFTEASAKEVIRSLKQPTQFRYKRDRSARLITRQVKQVMYSLLHQTIADVLDGLERELRGRDRSTWGVCFCTILILCMCVEMVQVAADVRVVLNMASDPSFTRDISIDLCRKLDEIPMIQCQSIFHGLHRTSKPKVGPRNEHGFNPLRDGLDLDPKSGITQELVDLVEDMRGIVHTYRDELPQRAQNPTLGSHPDPLSNHMEFRRNNSGRLVAKFLLSFS